MTREALRHLPSVDSLLNSSPLRKLEPRYGHAALVQVARRVLDQVRDDVLAGEPPPVPADLAQTVARHVEKSYRSTLEPVINATGVIVHTNLGRAPLSADAIGAMASVGAGYSNLEYDLAVGQRGSRYVHAIELLRALTGAEDALVVNNNAAATLLILAALARGREVIVSRGQLVEIGGGFRIPDVMAQSGARLVEVGTTNKTYVDDYRAAITDETALLMRVHTSNFRVTGFTSSVSIEELVALGQEADVPVVDDLGSGTLLDTTPYGLMAEPTVQDSVAAGAGLVCFSGDKLLGGPQAGIILGQAELIQRIKRFPMTRALRVDKTTLAGLQATLSVYLRDRAIEDIPVWRMIAASGDALAARARVWVERLTSAGIEASIAKARSTVGGGSLPGETLPTSAVAVAVSSPDALTAELRAATPPVIARIENDRLLLDPRTVLPEQDEALLANTIAAVRHVVGEHMPATSPPQTRS
jgi:L-seryl-tRNA(Ser) seleniumtransferase